MRRDTRMLSQKRRLTIPWWLLGIILVPVVLCIPSIVLWAEAIAHHGLDLSRSTDTIKFSELGEEGEFFGGNVAAITSSLTLMIVLATTYIQRSTDQRYRIREHFLAGLAVVGQYDVANPGCEQALRLLDYYSSIAMNPEDSDLLLLLNSVITKDIRARLDDLDADPKSEIYINARAARRRIGELLKAHHMRRKGKVSS
jgi:hypothetical protein